MSRHLTLTEAARVIPSRPHVSSVYRWATRGVRGQRLRTVLIGGQRYVTREDIDDFIRRLNRDTNVQTKHEPSAYRERAIRDAEKELEDFGI